MRTQAPPDLCPSFLAQAVSVAIQNCFQRLPRIRLLVLRNRFRRPFGDDLSAAFAAFGAEVDHPIGRFNHVQVVLDDDHGVAQVYESLQHVEQLAHVLEMQTRGRLVQDVDGAARGAARKLFGQLDALRLAAGERRRRLAEFDVAQADLVKRLQLLFDLWVIFEQRQGFFDRRVQQLRDVLALVAHVERLAVVSAAPAHFAGDVDVGQEVHLDALQPVALAGFAAAPFDVEREAAGLVAALAAFGQHRIKLADRREQPRVSRRIRPRRTPDRRLIDLDDLVYVFQAFNRGVRAGFGQAAVEFPRDRSIDNVFDQRRFAGAGDSGDYGEDAERE